MALRGLSHPTTSAGAISYGMIGMGIAIVTTLALATPSALAVSADRARLAIGGGAGAVTARSHPMTSMPQLVAAFHSWSVLPPFWSRPRRSMRRRPSASATIGEIHAQALVEMSLGVAIGAITFTGSVIAFLKLDGRMSGKPIMLPWPPLSSTRLLHADRLLRASVWLHPKAISMFWLIVVLSLALGVLLIVPIGGADMPVVVSMLNSYSGWAAAGIGFTLGNLALIITGALVGSSGAILSYIMCKGMNRSFISVILGGFGGETQRLPATMASAHGQAGLGRRCRLPDGQCAKGDHRARLRHGGRPGPACAARACRCAEEATVSR
jgi:NAD(P) transhydrogenase subunit beta